MNTLSARRLILLFRPYRVPRPLPGRVLLAYSVEAARDLLQHLQQLGIEFQPLSRQAVPAQLAALNAADSTNHSIPRKRSDRTATGPGSSWRDLLGGSR